MPVLSKRLDNGNKVEITIQGQFNFNDHSAFREAYNSEKSEADFVVDMKQAEQLDSAALGMLLMLREYAGGDDAHVSIVNTPAEIMKLLRKSNFENLFTIA